MNTNTKSAIFPEYQRFNLDKNKTDRFQRHQKNNKNSVFSVNFVLLKASFRIQKLTFTAKFRPRSSLEVILLAPICCPGRATASLSTASWPCLDFQRHHHTACWEIARHFDSVRSFPHILHIYTKSTATPTYHRNFALVVFFSGRKFQNMPW